MFKWLLLIFIGAFAGWVFAQDQIPDNIKFGKAGTYANSAVFNLKYELLLRKKADDSKVKAFELSAPKFEDIFTSLGKTKSSAVLFFYNSRCLFCKGFLRDVNEMIGKHQADGSKNVYYIIVAFDDDTKKVNMLLSSNYKDIKFKPLIMKEASLPAVQKLLAEKNANFTKVPVAIYRDAEGVYEVYKANSESFKKIEKKLDERS